MWGENIDSLLNLLPVGLLVLDRGGQLVSANRPGLDFLGLDERAIGRPDFGNLFESDTLRHALSAPANGVVRLNITVGAKTFHTEVRPFPGAEDGRKLLMVRDVTGLANFSQLRRNFVFDLLHKVRTPLTTIVSVLRMATSGRLDPNKVDLSEILGMGSSEADRLTSLLGRLKDLFLVESGSIEDEVSLEPVDVKSLLAQTSEDLRSRFTEKGLSVTMQAPDEPVRAVADPELLERVLEMVIGNACQYTPNGGTVQVCARQFADHVRITVSDDGPGIPSEELPHVFERFYRGDFPEVRSREGEGLGLYLARHLLNAQGGSILLDSPPDCGTTVEITLPACVEEA